MAINKISILLPVYNTPKEWLTDSVQSILNQTHKDFELLILDDGSSNPGTQQSLTDLEKIDSRISVKKNKSNLGLAKNLNQGLLLAKHQWVARMDSDDIAHPDRLKQQIHFLNKNNEVSILGTNIQCFDGSTRIIRYPTTHREISTSMLWGCQVAHPTVIYNKNTILSVGGYPEDKQNTEDYALWTKIIAGGPDAKFHNLPETLLDYRVQRNRKEYYSIQEINGDIIRKNFWENCNLNANLCYLLQRSLSRRSDVSSSQLERDLTEFLLSIENNPKIDEHLLKHRLKLIVSKFLRRSKKLEFLPSLIQCHLFPSNYFSGSSRIRRQ